MEKFGEFVTSQNVVYLVGAAVVAVVTILVVKKVFRKEEKNANPRDTVILHQIGRAHNTPSMTPFAVKLETYLRMARIPYKSVHDFKKSSKSKFPWIEYNGEPVADTTLCVEFLNKTLRIDLNKHLTPAQRGVGLALQIMCEEHLYWFLVIFRWVLDNDKSLILSTFKFNRLLFWFIRSRVSKQVWAQGLGRHTETEITTMMKKDLQALSDFIGKNKFLLGDDPSEFDCAVFGQLAELYWQFQGTGHENLISDKYPILATYCERMKTTFWPDWDECITHGGTRKATK